jgi:hypothetical protein
MGKAEIEAIGVRSSKDPFFMGKKDSPKPPSEIDRGDVKKGAYTNCIGNGITRLLGLRNLAWQDLINTGIKQSDVGKVDYGSKSQEMTPAAQDQKKSIMDMLNEMCKGVEKDMTACLVKITGFTGKDGKLVPGKSKIEDLSEKAITVTYGKLKEKYEKWQDEQPKQEPTQEGLTGGNESDS